MKKITLQSESSKNAVIKITNDIFILNVAQTSTYIRIGDDDELMLDENFTVYFNVPVTLDETKRYLKVYLTDIRIYQDEVENEMDLEEYIKEYGDDYVEAPEYQEEYNSIKEDLIADKSVPAVLDAINAEIDEYNAEMCKPNC
jgi:hypothetical protein